MGRAGAVQCLVLALAASAVVVVQGFAWGLPTPRSAHRCVLTLHGPRRARGAYHLYEGARADDGGQRGQPAGHRPRRWLCCATERRLKIHPTNHDAGTMPGPWGPT